MRTVEIVRYWTDSRGRERRHIELFPVLPRHFNSEHYNIHEQDGRLIACDQRQYDWSDVPESWYRDPEIC